MAHPSAAFPKSFAYVNDVAVPQNADYFTSVLCVIAGDVTLSSGTNSGAIFDNNDAADSVTIAMTAGMIIYGRFTSVSSDGTAEVIAYLP
jgi:hypothetical protein